jgi:hypothetical protein
LILAEEVNKSNVVSPVPLELLDHALLRRKIIVGKEKNVRATTQQHPQSHYQDGFPPTPYRVHTAGHERFHTNRL